MTLRSTCIAAAAVGLFVASARPVTAQTTSLQDVAAAARPLPQAVIYTAREIVTLDARRPTAQAVAVVGDRILATGTLAELETMLGPQPYRVDRTFADHVIVPGFIAQHDHPVLSALTMASEVLSIEEWRLPGRTIPAVKDKADFMARLAAAEKTMSDPEEALLSWGYHPNFYGPLTRADLDRISSTRPVIVWARSAHELILNGAALERAGITAELVGGWSPSQRAQSELAEGRFWEQGFFSVLAKSVAMIATPERMRTGLELTRDYMHAGGITYGDEPGGILVKPIQDAVNDVFSSPTMPFRWSFIADGKTLADQSDDDAQVLAEAEAVRSWYGGMTSQLEGAVKLFSDGAVYSQLMQLREPYLDNHHGEWMTDLEVFQRAFRIFWDAGYQIHVHVTGDAGVDRALDALEENLRRHPRYDHRTTLVHFSVSAPDQIERIRRLGAIVSGNPYYPVALADQYGKVGLGPERADAMVRLGDVDRAGIPFSLHSDMPMAPAQPLYLIYCAVNRITSSGRVAGPDQRVSAEKALRGVTIEAAYSLRLDHEMGSIESGKLANFTILGANPLTVEPTAIKDIPVWGTVMEGRVQPVARN